MSLIKILVLGDTVGPESVEYLYYNLPKIQNENQITLTVANGENASIGNGIDPVNADRIFEAGVDVITTGNHVWKKKSIYNYLNDNEYIIRPCNYGMDAPGQGYVIKNINGYSFLVINVMGVSFLDPLENPFVSVDNILSKNKGKYDISILDIHAEATGEKYALGNYFDGRIDIIFGTHTHVQTADEQILPKGSGFICDVGMCGPINSVLGIESSCIIEKLKTQLPQKYELSTNRIKAHGAIFTIDSNSFAISSVERVVF